MKELAFRLSKDDDLRRCIEDKCIDINTAIVLSCVGCLHHLNIRLAQAKEYLSSDLDYEIVSATGTISNGKAHIHISLADNKGNVVGGHLEYGCLVNTTCEIVIGVLQDYESNREFDKNTGYEEIKFFRK